MELTDTNRARTHTRSRAFPIPVVGRKGANRDDELSDAKFASGPKDPPEASMRFMRLDFNQDGILRCEEFVHMGSEPAK